MEIKEIIKKLKKEQSNKKWTLKNKDKISEYQRKYMKNLSQEQKKIIYKRQVNYAKKRRELLTIEEKEKKKEYMRAYYQKNKEKIQAYRKERELNK